MTHIANIIDHTLLKPDSTQNAIRQLCKEAMQYEFATVCIPPYWVPHAKSMLAESNVGITTVVGFPNGVTTTFAKAAETRDAIASGATEIDMVINVGALKSSLTTVVEHDIARTKEAAGEHVLKVILETGYLTDDEKRITCKLAQKAGADFVKTSTGFGPGAATVYDIELMQNTIGGNLGIKASGGIRDYATAEAMIQAGATRIGASASIDIVTN